MQRITAELASVLIDHLAARLRAAEGRPRSRGIGREDVVLGHGHHMVTQAGGSSCFTLPLCHVQGPLPSRPPKARSGKVRSGFPKRSCSNRGLKRDDDSTRSHRALEHALVHASEPLRQRPHYLQRKMRRLADEEEKLLFRDRDELDIRQRRGGRAPRLVVDQCHLAEDRVGREVRDGLVADLDAHIAALDDEELISLFAFAK
ncbi:hypothetical protein chiPu_0031328, partial [Chiloscyllium punctatum]|nr:hypothetical protein [Chiloscyllium punctatum]